MKVYIGADHGGYEMKEELKKWLKENGYHGMDLGAGKLNADDDFVDYGIDVAQMLVADPEARGIVLCRNGVGMSIVTNRLEGVRCVLGFEEKQVEKARMDDDVNCLSLPSDYIDKEKAMGLVKTFLETKFSGEERYKRRLAKLQMVGEVMGGCCGGGCGEC